MDWIKSKNTLKFILFIAVIILVWYTGGHPHIDTDSIEQFLIKIPKVYGSIVYVVLYVAVTFFLFFSKDIFWILGAIVFGPYLSALLVYIAEMINVVLLFNLARSLGSKFVEKHLKEEGKRKIVYEKLSNINFFWLCMMRFVPLVPYRFLDLGFGLTKMSFRRYLIAAIIGSPVKIFWLQYILAGVGKSILTDQNVLREYFLQNKPLCVLSFVYFILVIPVAFKLRQKY